MAKKASELPKFKSESAEADWWASDAGRDFVRKQSKTAKPTGSNLVAGLKQRSKQIAIRLPVADIEQARKVAGKKGIGYQTLLKMIVHEGLGRVSGR